MLIERGNYTVLFSFQGKNSSKRIPALFIGLAKGEAVQSIGLLLSPPSIRNENGNRCEKTWRREFSKKVATLSVFPDTELSKKNDSKPLYFPDKSVRTEMFLFSKNWTKLHVG